MNRRGGHAKYIGDLLKKVNDQHSSFASTHYEPKLSSVISFFETSKRKYEGLTGVPVEKKAKTSTHVDVSLAADKENSNPNRSAPAVAAVSEDLKPAANATAPPHPDDTLDIANMIVVDLRNELKKRDLDYRGRKKELQKRLSVYIEAARVQRRVECLQKNKISKPGTERVDGKVPEKTGSRNGGAVEEQKGDIDSRPEKDDIDIEMEDVRSSKIAIERSISTESETKSDQTAEDAKAVPISFLESRVEKNDDRKQSRDGPLSATLALPVPPTAPAPSAPLAPPAPHTQQERPKSVLKESKYSSGGVPNLIGTAQNQQTSSNKAQIDDLPKAQVKIYKPQSTIAKSGPIVESVTKSTSKAKSVAETMVTSSAALGKTNNKAKELSFKTEPSSVKATTADSSNGSSGGSETNESIMSASAKKLHNTKKERAIVQEERKARLAAMRGKVQVESSTTGDSSSINSASSHNSSSFKSKYKSASSSKLASSTSTKPKDAKSLYAKIREKTNAEKIAAVESQSRVKIPECTEDGRHKRAGTASKNAQAVKSVVVKDIKHAHPKIIPRSTTPQKIPVTSSNGQLRAQPYQMTALTLKPLLEEKSLSPIQTYEMSDHEDETDSDEESDEDEDDGESPKIIPEWAQKVKLHPALEKQFADGVNRADPDDIFGEVLTCNLEEIFDKKKARYKKRTSSGNWKDDHVTPFEKLSYKRDMGFD